MQGGTSTTLTLLVASASAMSWKAVNGKGCGMGYIHMDDPVTHGATPLMTLSKAVCGGGPGIQWPKRLHRRLLLL